MASSKADLCYIGFLNRNWAILFHSMTVQGYGWRKLLMVVSFDIQGDLLTVQGDLM